MNPITDKAIDLAMQYPLEIGSLVAMRNEPISHKLIDIRGQFAVVLSIDGPVIAWPIKDVFDVNVAHGIAVAITKRLNRVIMKEMVSRN